MQILAIKILKVRNGSNAKPNLGYHMLGDGTHPFENNLEHSRGVSSCFQAADKTLFLVAELTTDDGLSLSGQVRMGLAGFGP